MDLPTEVHAEELPAQVVRGLPWHEPEVIHCFTTQLALEDCDEQVIRVDSVS